MESDILSNIPVEIAYWNGSTNSTGMKQLNDLYDINQKSDIIFMWKAFNLTTYAQYIAYVPKETLKKDTQYSNIYGYCYNEGENNRLLSTHSYYIQQLLTFRYLNGAVSTVTSSQLNERQYLDTNTNYPTPYTPLYDGSPATKKYVDDAIGALTPAISSIEEVVG